MTMYPNEMDETRPTGDDAGWSGETDENDQDEQRIEQLTAEIDETRGELTDTVHAIGEKLEPANLAREASETVRQATTGKVEQMAIGAQETWRDVRSGNAGGIVETIKSNPIPAGMVALGLGMLFMNRGATASRSNGSNGHDYAYGYASSGAPRARASWEPEEWDKPSPVDRIGSTVSGAADQAGQTLGHVGSQASDAIGSVSDRVGEAVGHVGQTASEIPDQAGRMVGQGTSQVRRMIDENPLGAGVVALAAGAAIGMLIPTTRVERETMGETRDRLVERAQSTVDQALDQVDEKMDPPAESQG